MSSSSTTPSATTTTLTTPYGSRKRSYTLASTGDTRKRSREDTEGSNSNSQSQNSAIDAEHNNNNNNNNDNDNDDDDDEKKSGAWNSTAEDEDNPHETSIARSQTETAVLGLMQYQHHQQQQEAEVGNEDSEALVRLTDLLSVPLQFIFQQFPPFPLLSQNSSANSVQKHQQRQKPLLSRNEAQCFLTVTSLAMEFDSLVELASQVCAEMHELKEFRSTQIQEQGPLFLSLVAVKNVLGRELPVAGLARIQETLNVVLHKLSSLIEPLQQSSDQNWATYESLTQDDEKDESSANIVAVEKRRLAEVQEELARRIELLLAETSINEANNCKDYGDRDGAENDDKNANDNSEVEDGSKSNSTGVQDILDLIPMAQFCQQSFVRSASLDLSASPPLALNRATSIPYGETTPQINSSSQISRFSTDSKSSSFNQQRKRSSDKEHTPLQVKMADGDDPQHDQSSQKFDGRTENTQTAALAMCTMVSEPNGRNDENDDHDLWD